MQRAILEQEIEHIRRLEQGLHHPHNYPYQSYLTYKKELKGALKQLA
jgi:hypothetical protein